MGIFDFIKNLGAELEDSIDGKRGEEEAVDDRANGDSLTNKVQGLGLDVDNLRVAYADGVATVTGAAADQATREKVVLAIGNTNGVSRVDDQMTVESPQPEATFYTVQSGDSLSKIAEAQYGDAMKYPEIFEANQPMLSDPDEIYPGQVLRIPALSA